VEVEGGGAASGDEQRPIHEWSLTGTLVVAGGTAVEEATNPGKTATAGSVSGLDGGAVVAVAGRSGSP
jgi:hypothetical protein